MSRMFGSVAPASKDSAVRRQLLVKAAPERWADLLQGAARDWEIVWVSSDEQLEFEIARGNDVALVLEAIDQHSLFPFLPELIGDNFNASLASCPDPQLAELRIDRAAVDVLLLHGQAVAPATPLNPWFEPGSVLASIRSDISPSDFQQWLDVAFGVSQLISATDQYRRRLLNRQSPLIGNSAPLRRLREQIAQAALCDWPVLIQGESGTGRGLVAQAIHEASHRSICPLITIDCRVYSSTSLSRELFGESAATAFEQLGGQSSAFSTDSVDQVSHLAAGTIGRLESAEGGVLLIEGIDEMALPLQAVVAQVIEQKWFQKLGARQESSFNVRIIAATSKDLSQLSRNGQFREELLKHFVGPVLQTAPLREILTDMAPLAEHLLQRIGARLGVGSIRLSTDSISRLQAYSWPGNVSELEALLERACLLNPGGRLTPEMVDSWLAGESQSAGSRLPSLTLAQMERQLIEATFTRYAGNRELTAQSLQIGLRTLSGKLREYGYPPRGGPGSNRQQSQRDVA